MLSLTIKKQAVFSLNYSLTVVAIMVVPYLFHLFDLPGQIFLPIYTAIVIAGFISSSQAIIIAAFTAPFFNYLVSGMPPIAPVPIMQFLTIELTFMAIISRLLNKNQMPLIVNISLVVIGGRLISGISFLFFSTTTFSWVANGIINSWPGMVINVLVPYIIIRSFRAAK